MPSTLRLPAGPRPGHCRRHRASPSRFALTAALLMVVPILLAAWPGRLVAQAPAAITQQQVQARLDLVTTSADFPDDVREAAAANYRAALERLGAAADARTTAEAFNNTAADAPARIEELARSRREMTAALAGVEGDLADVPAAEAAQRLVTLNADQLQLRERKDALERQLAGRLTRPIQLRDEIAAATARVDELGAQADAIDDTGSEPEQSQRLLLLARLEASQADRQRLQAALATLQPRLDLAEAELQLVNAQRALNDRRITLLAAKVAEERESESARAARQGQTLRELATTLPAPLAEQTVAVASLYDELVRTLNAMRARSAEVTDDRATRERIARDYEAIRSRVQVAGAQAALGQLLRSQRLRLPDVRELRRALVQSRETSATAGLRNLELVDLQREHDAWVEELQQTVATALALQAAAYGPPAEGPEAPAVTPPGNRAQVTPAAPAAEASSQRELEQAADLLADRRFSAIDQLADAYSDYVTLLADSAFEKQSLLNLTREYGAYLDDRLLWVPSAEPINLDSILGVADAVGWLISWPHWRAAGDIVRADVIRNGGWYLISVLLLLLGIRSRRALVASIQSLGQRARKIRTDRFGLTLEAMLLTAALAAMLPAIPVALGLRWQVLPLPEQVRAVAMVLPYVGYSLALSAFFRLLCMPQGVARLHFHWSESRISLWPRAFLVVQALWLPLFAVGKVGDLQSSPEIQNSLGRLGLAGSSVVLAFVFSMLLHPRTGLPAAALAASPQGWAARLARLWYPAAVGIPLVLAAVALLGYQYAAELLIQCVLETVLLLIGGMLVFDLLERWIKGTRQRFRYRQILERRAATREGEAATASDGVTTSGEGAAVETETIDIGDFDDQTRRLMTTLVITVIIFGAWLIWSKALPVLGLLDQVVLWQDGTVENGPAVTLEDVVIALVTLFLVVLATRNLPSLLEFAVLKNLPLDAGSRYAIRTVSQYLLVGVGIVVISTELGLAWTQVQWLVAALSVGLGFGLQEIFANFVSGLIILLERPVRVGDTVTVGDVSGTVTRIRIRATTITDWDNKEVIVPNKTFITGQLINWTLSNEITRVVVPIGIAYGSDVQLAIKVIQDAAQANPLVLDDPAPRVLFKAFGDSSLDFDVHIHARQLADRLPARHEFLLTLERTLTEAGITIPFPQRDVHIHHHRAAGSARGGGGQEVVEQTAAAKSLPR